MLRELTLTLTQKKDWIMEHDFTPLYISQREKELEKKRAAQRVAFALRNEPNTSTAVASETVAFQQKHYSSMSDALAEVRKSKVTHADTTQVTRPNSKGFNQ